MLDNNSEFISKNEVVMEWMPKPQNQWHMSLKRSGLFLQEFFNCGQIKNFFKGLDKDNVSIYEITIRKIK